MASVSEPTESRHDLPSEKVSILPGADPNLSSATYVIVDEDHTMGNVLRYMIMRNPKVQFCGYTAPHPSEPKIHMRIQMYDGASSVEAFRRGLDELEEMVKIVSDRYRETLEKNHPDETPIPDQWEPQIEQAKGKDESMQVDEEQQKSS